MSSDYVRLQDSQKIKGEPMFGRSVRINDSVVNQESLIPNQSIFEQTLNEEDSGSDIDDYTNLAQDKFNAQKETTEFTSDDTIIKDYFLKTETKSPLVYLDVKTTFDTSLKLSDNEIICFEAETRILKKISMLKKEEDLEKKKTFARTVLLQISQEELLKQAVQIPLEQDNVEDRQILEEELAIEKVTKVESTSNKKEILVGTSLGRIAVISAETFEVHGILVNSFESPVIDITTKKTTLIVGHENGQIVLFEKLDGQQLYKKSTLQSPCDSLSHISINSPQYKCPKDHTLVLYLKDPYTGNARCDECKTNRCITLGWLYHCPECQYDLCKNCCQDYDKFGKKIEVTCEDSKGHKLSLYTKDPYGGGARCDECKTNSISNMGYLFHCDQCQYDLCKNCDMGRNGKRFKPTCQKRHEMQLIKQKPSYYKGNPNCDFCGKSNLQNDKIWYHCKDCKYDKCYYCETKEATLALKTSDFSDHLAVVQKPNKESGNKKHLFIYNLKEKKRILENDGLVFLSGKSYEYKNLICFTSDSLVARSDNRNSYKIISLKTGKVSGQGPESIDSQSIQKLQIWKDNKTIILIGQTGNFYLYDQNGKVAILEKSKLKGYVVWGTKQVIQFTSLQDKVTILRLNQQIYDQQQVITENQNSLYFSDVENSFFIELRGTSRPSFPDLRDALITPNGKIFAQEKNIDGTISVVIYDLVQKEELKIFPGYELVCCSENGQFIYCRTTKQGPKMSVKINLQNFEIQPIFESENLAIQVNKNDTRAYIRQKNQDSQEYELIVVDIQKRAIVFVYKNQFKTEFNYRLSIDEKYIILITKDNKLQKIQVIDENELKFENEIPHEPGLTGWISFDKNSTKFICGGENKSDLIIYSSKLEVINTIEQHKGNSNLSFFTKANRAVTKGQDGTICWDLQNPVDPVKLFQAEVGLNIFSYNRRLIGFMIDNEPRIWNERLMHEFSNNIKMIQPSKFQQNKKKSEWTIGPLNKLLPQILQQFWDSNFEEQKLRLPHILKFVILPYGFTFLEKLVFDNKQDLIVESIKDSNMKYITDIYGNNPLTYALKRKNFEVLNILLNFFIQNPDYINNLRFIEFISLLELGPSQIPELLDKFIQPIMQNENLGQKVNDDYETYFVQDPLKKFHEEKVKNTLLKKDSDEKDKYPIVFNKTMMSLRFTCKTSTQLYEALDQCPCEEIFHTNLIRKIIDYKWSKIRIVANFFLAIQIAFVLNVTFSSFQPGRKFWLYSMMFFALIFAVCEFIIFKESKYSFVYVDKLKLVIILMVFVYCIQTLQHMTEFTDHFLPFINLFAWINMVIEMQQFEKTRQFVCIFMSSIQSIKGFLIFLGFMIATFATTSNLFLKNDLRHEAFKDDKEENWYFEDQFFQKNNATRPLIQDIGNLTEQTFKTWVTIVKGDFDDKLAEKIYYQLFILILTFVANVTLLNLIVAIMGDAYGEVMTSIVAKKTKSLNNIMLRYDKIMITRQEKSTQKQLIWVAYADDESAQVWTSQVDAINTCVKKSAQDLLNKFQQTEKFNDERQKEQANLISTLAGRVGTIKSDIQDDLKQIKSQQEISLNNQRLLLEYKNKEENEKKENEKKEKEKEKEKVKESNGPKDEQGETKKQFEAEVSKIVELIKLNEKEKEEKEKVILKKLEALEANQKQFQAEMVELIKSMIPQPNQVPVDDSQEENQS